MLLFVDNIFRFTQAGSEVSALLGRMPSAVGYQPTLATEMGALQERITSTQKGSITSVQAIYVPADDLTDPAPATSFAHLDATTVLSRRLLNWAFIRRSIRSIPPRAFSPQVVGDEHYAVSRVQQILQRYKDLQDIIAILGMDELFGDDKMAVARRARSSASSRSRSMWRKSSPARPASMWSSKTPSAASRVFEGKYDHLPEQAFYMVGSIEEAVEKGKKLRRRPNQFRRCRAGPGGPSFESDGPAGQARG